MSIAYPLLQIQNNAIPLSALKERTPFALRGLTTAGTVLDARILKIS